ncbi:MAG: GNAT family N-acetyltransferase [Abitibacteriaceae bacterium]|nr:GNAT family N-acetyltransferase [Abditibacteriaceae bacterium]
MPQDAAALYDLARITYTAAFGHSMSAADLEAHLANHLSLERMSEMIDNDTFLLACSAEEIVGFVQFGVSHLHEQELISSTAFAIHPSDREIRRLYVLASHQNQGIGSLLMEAALNHPCLINHNIFLDVWEENPGAQRFYGRYGFEKVAEKQFSVGSGAETGVDFIMRRLSSESLRYDQQTRQE